MSPYDMPDERRRKIINALFKVGVHDDRRNEVQGETQPFTLEELQIVTRNMKNAKAPGIDGIPPDAVKEVVKGKSDGCWK